MMMGMFRVIAGDKVSGIELYTIEPAANGGIEEDVPSSHPRSSRTIRRWSRWC
jgi:hypothetical protein